MKRRKSNGRGRRGWISRGAVKKYPSNWRSHILLERVGGRRNGFGKVAREFYRGTSAGERPSTFRQPGEAGRRPRFILSASRNLSGTPFVAPVDRFTYNFYCPAEFMGRLAWPGKLAGSINSFHAAEISVWSFMPGEFISPTLTKLFGQRINRPVANGCHVLAAAR